MSTLSLCDAKTAVIEYARLRFQTSPDWLGFLADVRDYSEQAMGPDAALRFFREPDFGEVHGMVVKLAMRSVDLVRRGSPEGAKTNQVGV